MQRLAVRRAQGLLTQSVRRYWSFSKSKLPTIKNETMLNYAPGSPERAALRNSLAKMKKESPEIPCIVGGKEIRTGKVSRQVMPSDHKHVVCTFHEADDATVKQAIDASLAAKAQWEATSFETRAAIFLKAADLLSTKYRADLCAATMLGQSKNVWQAEIDAAAEMADFWRFNAKYMEEIYSNQPTEHSPGVWNRLQYRPLEGFVLAVTPFNFTAIGGNLPSAPAIMGNTVLWKPSHTAMLANYLTYELLVEAGLPPGVINFLPGDGALVGKHVFSHRDFAGLHFTGSTATFNLLWKSAAENLPKYRSYPRIVGETGGKNFHFVHKSADPEHVVMQTIRSAFEYQGQKCSACSRAYIPSNLWPKVKERLVQEISKIKIGQPDDFESFMCAVIDEKSFTKIQTYIEQARRAKDAEILIGGQCDKSRGYFVNPTVIVTTNPQFATMREEIFGPVLTIYVYPENEFEETLKICDDTADYALTGAIFSSDRAALDLATDRLRNASGNFYINDKSTGAVVGQQAFGGARRSGTNDKAGASLNLYRWTSVRTIKESSTPITKWSYPHQAPGH